MTKPQELSIDSLKNCCTHNIDVELPTGEIVTIRPSNTTIRIVTGDGVKCIAGGIPIAQKVYFHSALLPPEIPGVIYIVPKQVALVYAEIRTISSIQTHSLPPSGTQRRTAQRT